LQDQIAVTRTKIHAAAKREHNLMALISASDARRAALEGTIGRLTDQLAVAHTALARLDAQMGIVAAQEQIATNDLGESLAELQNQRDHIASRAAGLYMNA